MGNNKPPAFVEAFINKLLGVLSNDPTDWVELARGGEPPHPECECMKCSFARGEMPKPPSKPEDVLQTTLNAMDSVQETTQRSLKAGAQESQDLVRSPYPPAVELVLLEHRVGRYNASAKAVRALNELLAEGDRVPERLLPKTMSVGTAVEVLEKAREVMAEKLAAVVAERAKAEQEAKEREQEDAAQTPFVKANAPAEAP